MSSKVKRKVTVENSKDSSDHPKRPSVFERLGPGAVNVTSQSQDRPGRMDQNEKCRNWLRAGTCNYGNTCRFQHDFPPSTKRSKNDKSVEEKDFKRKMKSSKHDEIKESKTGSLSPKRKDKKRRSRSRSRKGEHESKIKSTVVVTRPRSPPTTTQIESLEKDKKKAADGSWEDDSDDWPIDAAQLDYKEELTLERKRQQLKRELELEMQKERMLSLNQPRSASESSSTSSSSDSGSISSSSDSSSSSSDEDSDESSSSTSSSSSSASRTPVKKKSKKPQIKKELARDTAHKKPSDDYDKAKNRAIKSSWRPRSPSPEAFAKKGHDQKKGSQSSSFSPKRRSGHDGAKGVAMQGGRKGPRTPSPAPVVSKQRQWAQSSSADSRSDTRRNRSKRHKKKKDSSRNDKNRVEYVPTPPPLSSPNRTALQPHLGKKSRHRDDSGLKGHHRGHDQSPALLSRVAGQSSNSPSLRHGNLYSEMDRFFDKQSQSKSHNRKMDEVSQSRSRRDISKERSSKHSRMSSPGKDSRRLSTSPPYDKYDDSLSKGMYSPPLSRMDKDDGRRRNSLSPIRKGKDGKDKKKGQNDFEKWRENRDFSPRSHDNRRDTQYKGSDSHRKEEKESKKRDDKIKDRGQRDRSLDHDNWSDEPKKGIRSSDSRRIVESVLPQSVRGDRSRDRERDRKSKKDRDLLPRPIDDLERQRLSPTVSLVPSELHHPIRDDISRGRLYDPEIPPESRDYAYGYVAPRDPVYPDDPALPPDFEADLRVAPLYHPPPDPLDFPPPSYAEPRYRRDPALKAVTPVPHIDRIGGYSSRDISPLGPRDPVGLPVRDDDYLADIPLGDRPYDERWRGRSVRDDWDSYPPLVSESLPPHASDLDEDRYGMPRRRRASPPPPPNWLVRRDDRDVSLREPRSRSPPPHRREDLPSSGRGGWGGDHHNNRNIDLRQDGQQKSNLNQDDRRNRNVRKDNRRDRGKRTDEQLNESKPPISKEKTGVKRPHSTSPNRKDAKKRKEDTSTTEPATNEKSSVSKKTKDETAQPDAKTTTSGTHKMAVKVVSKKKRRGKGVGEDDFSDWSEGDDDLLNRDDSVESESNSGDRTISKGSSNKKEKSAKTSEPGNKESTRKPKTDSSKEPRAKTKEAKSESHTRTSSKERYDSRDFERLLNYSRKFIDGSERNRIQPVGSKRIVSEVPTVKLGPAQISKEKSPVDPAPAKKDAETEKNSAVENKEFELEPISDGELEELTAETDESIMKTNSSQEPKIVDALDIDWSILMKEAKPELPPSKARNKFKAAHVLSRIGFSQSLAGSALSEKIKEFCQKQLDEEKDEESSSTVTTAAAENKFVMEHPVASFHVSLMQKKKERRELFDRIGASRRALCARQDLYIRKLLCRPVPNLVMTNSSLCVQQYNNVETDQSGKPAQTSTVLKAVC